MARSEDEIAKHLDELNNARAEVDRPIKYATENPAAKTDRQEFWNAMQRVVAAKRALTRH